MKISLIIFIISGSGIILMLALKLLQEKLGMLLFWPDARERVEKKLQKHSGTIRSWSAIFCKRNIYLTLAFILSKLRSFFIYIQHKIDKKIIKLVNLVKGRHIIEQKGTASSFLHDITSSKERFKNW